jgi:virginiamycin B lyase
MRAAKWLSALLLMAWGAFALGQSDLAGLASVSGSVSSPTPYKAAKVFFRNPERRMQYMVYTAGGKYQAMHLLPGNYEMRVEAAGLSSPPIKLVLASGKNPAQNAALAPASDAAQVVPLAQLFPQGPGRAYLTDTCMGCHGPDFFGARHMPAAAWSAFVEMMQQSGNLPNGFASPQEREELVQYLGKHFGPDAKKRAAKYDRPIPLDEAKLAKAMFVEYYLKPNDAANAGQRRRGQDPHFDRDGNVWVTDRNVPNRLSRLNPRSGEWKDWLMPHPDGETHGLTIDRDGIVWVPERPGQRKDKDGLHLAAFDPKTEKWETFPIDPEGKIKEGLRSHTPVVDAQGNVWSTMIRGDRFFKWDKQTRKISVFTTPTRPSAPYGIDIDSKGNIWMALFRGDARVGKYDPAADKFTEYKALTANGRIRRASVDLEDRVWYGVYDKGVIGWIDPASGKASEIKVPLDVSHPYDPQADLQGVIWFGDDGQGGTTVAYNPKSREFSFYPSPQFADQPKIEITRDGAVWYCPRSGAEPGAGVLYSDVSKITTMGAYYLDTDSIASRKAVKTKLLSKN